MSVPKTQLTAISIIIGLVGGLICAIVSHNEIVVDVIAGLSVAIFTVQVGEILSHSSLSGKRESLERAMDSRMTFERINSILNNLESIEKLRTGHPEADPFVQECLHNCFTTLNGNLGLIACGEVRIDSTCRELTTNKEFLLTLPSHLVRAVSYQDEEFWTTNEGTDFLRAHEEAIANGREIHRIFVLKQDNASRQRATISKQMDTGIKCYIVIEENLSAEYHEDFVVYDDKYARVGKLISEEVTCERKVATLTSP